MSVLIDTSLGAITVDLEVDACPNTSKNFIKLCKIKYFNGCLFYNVQPDFIVQTGDPSATGRGGSSVYGLLYGDQARFFEDELHADLRHDRKGTLSMANAGSNTNGSQFLLTTRDECSSLNDRNTVFGRVVDGIEVLDAINRVYVDDGGRPYQDVRITHTHVLVDPFPDPPGMAALIPPKSPAGTRPSAEAVPARLPIEEQIELPPGAIPGSGTVADPAALAAAESAQRERLAEEEARARAVVLEMTGDLPSADAAPPENVLFVCKLNPVTRGEDLATIFSRFGEIKHADVIRDQATGDSLCYAFIEFADRSSCESAYAKMNNVLIDDRRIKVDFSQSVSRLWNRYSADRASGRGRGRGGAAGRGGRGGTQGGRPGPGPVSAPPPAYFDERRGGLQRVAHGHGGGPGPSRDAGAGSGYQDRSREQQYGSRPSAGPQDGRQRSRSRSGGRGEPRPQHAYAGRPDDRQRGYDDRSHLDRYEQSSRPQDVGRDRGREERRDHRDRGDRPDDRRPQDRDGRDSGRDRRYEEDRVADRGHGRNEPSQRRHDSRDREDAGRREETRPRDRDGQHRDQGRDRDHDRDDRRHGSDADRHGKRDRRSRSRSRSHHRHQKDDRRRSRSRERRERSASRDRRR